MRLLRLWAAPLVAVFAAAVAAGACAETLRIGGTGSALATVEKLAQVHVGQHPAARLDIVTGLGSRGSVRAVGAGAIDLAVTGREVDAAEQARGLAQIPLGRTPLGFVTSNRRARNLTLPDLAGIISGRITEWPDGTPIRLVLRDRGESDVVILLRELPALAPDYERLYSRRELPVAVADADNMELAADLPGSLALAPLSHVLTAGRPLIMLTLDGVEPSIDALESGRYQLQKQVFLAFRAPAPATLQRFLDFVGSEEGRRIARAAGFAPPGAAPTR